MFAPRRVVPALPLLLWLGCSESDDPAGPGPDPVGPPTIESFGVTDPDGVILHGDFTTLRWRASGATSASLFPPAGAFGSPENGTVSIRPSQPVTYTLTVSNAHGEANAQVTVDVQYRAGMYVNPATGDDANGGQSPAAALATLGEALNRSLAGGVIFLAAGTYTTAVSIDGAQVSIYGGLDPATFFEGEPRSAYVSVVRPASGIPLSIRNSFGTMEISNITFDARDTQALGAEIVDAQARLLYCSFDTRSSLSLPAGVPAALSVRSEAAVAGVEVRSCRIFGPRSIAALETRGISLEQGPSGGAVDAAVAQCFIYGGRAANLSSGVFVDTDGNPGIGVCTIGAEITATGGPAVSSAAIRILRGHPFIGGNVLFTRGNGPRFGVIEGAVDTNPSSLEGNYFVSVGTIPYDNFDDVDPVTESELNQPPFTVGVGNDLVFYNLLETSLSVTNILANVDQGDFHLVHPIGPPLLIPNPAADRGDQWVANPKYGAVGDDIDGDSRPSSMTLFDLGADED
ncbi:MAG: hypothetical protein ACT4PE_17620 [Candidatus Eiseniibacteriota bacterium]